MKKNKLIEEFSIFPLSLSFLLPLPLLPPSVLFCLSNFGINKNYLRTVHFKNI